MKKFLLATVMGLAMSAPAHAESPVVLELFTSQGCSSCPPADELLQKLSAEPGLLALSFHVDYWDALGWRDPFSLAASTQRQWMYSHAFKQGNVYTPELVIDGTRGVVGSRKGEVASLIEEAKAKPKPVSVTVTPDANGHGLSISVDGHKPTGPAGIWFATFNPHAVTAIRGGENSGREMTSINNVKSITRIGAMSGATPQVLQVAMSDDPSDGYAVMVQAISGEIIGAGIYLPGR